MNVDSLADDLTAGLEPPVSLVCKSLITRFAETPIAEQRRLTFKLLADYANMAWDDSVFQAAVTALTTIRHHPLKMYFVMTDMSDGREIAIETNYVKRCLAENVFVHPRTGEEMPDFESKLIPVFCVTNSFKALLDARHD